MKEIKISFLIIFFNWVGLAGFAQCNLVQNLSSTQQIQLQSLQMPIDTALFYENLTQIDSLQNLSKGIYGNQSGIPDVLQTNSALSTNTTWLPMPSAIALSRLLIAADSLEYVDIWKVCKGMAPPSYLPHSIFLRSGAEICIGLLRIAAAETDPLRASAYRQWAIKGLDSLMTMQLASGAFPFPDLRTYNDPVFTPIINSYMQSLGADSVNVLLNGWIIDDSGTGEFKFDAGVIGGAFAEAYIYTQDTNYRNASTRVANYLLPLHFNTNFNYNTFASFGMILAWNNSQTNSTWRARANTTLRYSVLPGQNPKGRWMDGHNAKSVYHAIIIEKTSAVLISIDSSDPLKDTLSQMLCGAIRNFISQNDTCGSTTGYAGLIRAHKLDSTIIPIPLHDSITDLIGRYIQQSAINGRYLDVYTMGLYLELIGPPLSVSPAVKPNFNFNIYPNPAYSNLSIEFDLVTDSNIQLEIVDLFGRTLGETQNLNLNAGHQQINYSVKDLPNGIFFLRISSEINCNTFKILISK